MKITRKQLRSVIKEALSISELTDNDKRRIISDAERTLVGLGGVHKDAQHFANLMRRNAYDAMRANDGRLSDDDLPNEVILAVLRSAGIIELDTKDGDEDEGIVLTTALKDEDDPSLTDLGISVKNISELRVTRKQLGRIIREQLGMQISLDYTGPGMRRELFINIMEMIQKWRGMTNRNHLNDEDVSAYASQHGGLESEKTFDQYADEALDAVKHRIFKDNLYSPTEWVAVQGAGDRSSQLSEMRATRSHLRRIISEAIAYEAEPFQGDELDYSGQDLPDPYEAADISPAIDGTEGWLHAYDAWAGGMSPGAYASRMTILPLETA
jgi:hypothetical protein